MKKMVKGIGMIICAGVFLFSANANAAHNDFVHFSDEGLRDDMIYNIKNITSVQERNELEQLSEQFNDGKITEEEYERAELAIEKKWENKFSLEKKYGVFTTEALSLITSITPDWTAKYTTINGLENALNLKSISGEEGTTKDLRPLRNLEQLEYLQLEITNQLNLYDLKNAKNLKTLRLNTRGYGNYEDEENEQMYTQALLTDISALSDLNELERISIGTEGIMPTITLKKGTTSYQLFDPVVPSSQFGNASIEYFSDIKSNEWLEWTNLTGNEKYLKLTWEMNKDNFSFSGYGQIPIRWK